jgi:hypothetical protein
MISLIKSGRIPITVACKSFTANHLHTEGLSMEVVMNKDIPQITFLFDNAGNFEVKDDKVVKEAAKFVDNADKFKYLMVNDPALIMGVFNKLNSLSNADKAVYNLEMIMDEEGNKKSWKVFLNFQANKLKLSKA